MVRAMPTCKTGHGVACISDEGFSLPEVLVALVVTLLLGASAAGFVLVQLAAAQAQPEAADVQQRARAAAATLTMDLASAGAGSDYTSDGGIACCIPALQPRRIGLLGADPSGTASQSTLSVTRLAPQAAPVPLREALVASPLIVDRAAACPPRGMCGMAEGDSAVVFDAEGNHDFVSLGVPGVDSAPFTPRQAGPVSSFSPGAFVGVVETRTYYLDEGARQLRQYDGHLSDVPVIDDVVGLQFEYWGDEGAPGRSPVSEGVATCWLDASGANRFGGATPMGAPLVRIDLASFRDGPWCGSGVNRFDADLLRIRRVVARVRVAAASEWARGLDTRFGRAGRGQSALRLVPDVELVVDVTPRNLNADR